MPRATTLQKNAARRMYEQDGESYAAIGRHFGYSLPTVSKWAKDGGWVKAGTVTEPAEIVSAKTMIADGYAEAGPPVDDYNVTASTAPVASDDELRARVEALEARNADLEAENKQLKPTHELEGMFDDRVRWLTDNSPEGERYWLNRAEAKFSKDNLERAKQGLPVFDIKQHPDLLDDLIIELQTKEAMAKDRTIDSPPSRKVKMFIMRNGMPTIEQIPLEGQVNNMAGSLADGIVRYTQKGFKMTDPFLCPRAGCFKAAGLDEFKRWAFDGYCTEQHRTEVEGDEKSPTVGLQTRDTILSGTI